MQYWQWVVGVEKKHDLAAAATWEELRAAGCFPRCVLFALKPEQTGHVPWAGYYRRRWGFLVRAFRSVVKRLKGGRVRSPGRMRPAWADLAFRLLARELWPQLLPPQPGYRSIAPPGFGNGPHARPQPGRLISKATFAGVRLTVPLTEADMSAAWHDRAIRDCRRWGVRRDAVFAIDQWWMEAFGSLITDDITPPVCSACGTILPPTPKGKPRRAETCRKCADAIRYKRLKEENVEKLREQWATNQRRRRDRVKAPRKRKPG